MNLMNFITRSLGALTAGLLALGLAACGGTAAPADDAPATNSEPIVLQHAQGETTIDAPAQRIVVLDLGALDTLAALGVADSVVGITRGNVLPESLSQFDDEKFAPVGSVKEPDLEAVAALDPDLVIAGFRSAALVEELSKNFKTIDVTFDYADGFYEGIEFSTHLIAKAVGKEAEAEVQLKEVADAMATAKEQAPTDKTALILMTSGGKVSAQGADSRFGLVHTELGIQPAISDVEAEAHGDAISFEAISETNPDILYVVDRDAAIGQDGEAAEQVLDNELVATTNAWKNDKVVYLDGGRWYIMIHGVDNAVEMLNEATRGL
ncbi:siderophore ABC transporter substrate-binding protein [Tessaracoccus antarcticus]|uniref:Iron ABC transporter substrate-binding protein n=1 Tax=Tessaracoccus antarcticus TaxID=2479848 RepID=A0A3M0GB88_9ACTN|nr:ABC transporter substrate-binding protein [Tessaracoccus antarcticus]RMB62231.1 iron ABC transporter substrate-binding protein [Tessaracoccus antarcticus]